MNPATAAPATAAPAAPAAAVAPIETVTGADLLGALPPVNPRVVALPSPAVTPAPASQPGTSQPDVPVDAFGVRFRKGFHRELADGTPFRGTRGQFMPRGGRKAGVSQATAPETGSRVPADLPRDPATAQPPPSAEPPPQPPPAGAVPTITPEVVTDEDRQHDAETALRGAYYVADEMLANGSGEWQPDSDAEHRAIRDFIVSALKLHGKPLPRWIIGTLTAAAFVLKRIRRPNTAKTLKRVFPEKPAQQPAPTRGTPPQPSEPQPQPAAPLAVGKRTPSADLGDY